MKYMKRFYNSVGLACSGWFFSFFKKVCFFNVTVFIKKRGIFNWQKLGKYGEQRLKITNCFFLKKIEQSIFQAIHFVFSSKFNKNWIWEGVILKKDFFWAIFQISFKRPRVHKHTSFYYTIQNWQDSFDFSIYHKKNFLFIFTIFYTNEKLFYNFFYKKHKLCNISERIFVIFKELPFLTIFFPSKSLKMWAFLKINFGLWYNFLIIIIILKIISRLTLFHNYDTVAIFFMLQNGRRWMGLFGQQCGGDGVRSGHHTGRRAG